MEHENAFSTGPVRCVSASTYLRLRFLDAHTVSEEVGTLVARCAAAVHGGGQMQALPSHRMPMAALHCGPLTLAFVCMYSGTCTISFYPAVPLLFFECSSGSTCRARSSANCCTGEPRRCCVGLVWATVLPCALSSCAVCSTPRHAATVLGRFRITTPSAALAPALVLSRGTLRRRCGFSALAFFSPKHMRLLPAGGTTSCTTLTTWWPHRATPPLCGSDRPECWCGAQVRRQVPQLMLVPAASPATARHGCDMNQHAPLCPAVPASARVVRS